MLLCHLPSEFSIFLIHLCKLLINDLNPVHILYAKIVFHLLLNVIFEIQKSINFTLANLTNFSFVIITIKF